MKSNDLKHEEDEVQKALALKRHEQPSARFFQAFSHEVIDRIHSSEPAPPATLREKLGLGDDWKPVVLCGVGVVACLVLGISLVAALWVEKPDHSTKMTEPDPAATSLSEALGGEGNNGTLPGFQTLDGNSEDGVGVAPVVVPGSTESPFLKGDPVATKNKQTD
jgi:hypothetical protein